MGRRGICIGAAVILLLSGCGRTSGQEVQKERPSVVAIVKAMDSLHWMSVQEGLEQAALKYGVDLNILWPESEDDSETQNRMIEEAIDAKPDALILAPCDSENVGKYLSGVDEQTTSILFMDEEGASDSDIPFVGSDNYRAGELAAQKLIKELPEDSKVAVIDGSQSQTAHQKRAAGFQDYIQSYSNLEILDIKEVPGTTMSGGREAMKEILMNEPEVAGVFCASAMLVMGALEENELYEREDILLVGMDTQSDALSALQNGKILAMISQNGYEIGYTALKQAIAISEGSSVPAETFVDNEIITKDTADDFLQRYVMEGRS